MNRWLWVGVVLSIIGIGGLIVLVTQDACAATIARAPTLTAFEQPDPGHSLARSREPGDPACLTPRATRQGQLLPDKSPRPDSHLPSRSRSVLRHG